VAERAVDLLVRDFGLDDIVTVRREVERLSGGAGLAEPALYRFVVAVHEVVTNAVRHGGGAGRLRLWLQGRRLHCRVTDRGAGIPAERRADGPRPDPGTVGGWGLWLARQGCDALTVDSPTGGGSTVTLVRSLDEAVVRAS
jgi:anti-sigma regulatory factor (Ser/Thr protein kinase)